MNRKCIYLLIAGVFFTLSATAQKMVPDAAFGNNGVVITPEQNRFGIIDDMLRQTDGKIIVAGATYAHIDRTTCIARYLPNGVLDSSFGTNGKTHLTVGTYSGLQAIAMQADGKIVAVGNETIMGPITNTRPFLIRYNSDGSPDNTFGNAGVHYLSILNPYFGRSGIEIAVLNNGDILLAGNGSPVALPLQMMLLCLKSDGTYQTNFGTGGVASYTVEAGKNATIYGMDVQPDGKILICGYTGNATLTAPPDTKMAIARIKADGTPDSSFGTNGFVAMQVSPGVPAFDLASKVKLQTGGKVLVTGGSSGKLAAARLMPNGAPDPSFDQDGILYNATLMEPEGLAALSGERILLAGTKTTTTPAYTTDIILNSITNQGAVDFSFGTVGSLVIDESDQDEANVIAVHSNGKILMAGHTEDPVTKRASFALWQLMPDPTGIDEHTTSFASVYPNPTEGMVDISLHQQFQGVANISLLDITGKTVLQTQTTSNKTTLDMNTLPAGNYVLQIATGEQVQTMKLVKN